MKLTLKIDARYWASLLRPHALGSIEGTGAKTKSAAWRKIPSAYLICEDDRCFPVVAQEAIAEAIREAGCKIEIERVASSHSSHLSRPPLVADFMRRAAGEKL